MKAESIGGAWAGALAFALASCLIASCQAQQSMGSVALADATVTNANHAVVGVSGGRAELVGSSTVTAKDHTAEIALRRAGVLRVCQTTALQITESSDASLLLALDRGAIEVRMKGGAGDIVMTPDLRFTFSAAGPLDMRMRVTRNGDTCVENRGRKAPSLRITDAFGEASYEVKPGQHVLFEHGSLREVVDRETTPCGCPPDERPGVSIAEAVLAGGQGGSGAKLTPKQAEAAHPFPAAVSEGMAQPTPLKPEAPGGTHVQVATTLDYDPAATNGPATTAAIPRVAAEPTIEGDVTKTAPSPKRGPLRAIGRFFKRIFVR